MALRCIGLQPHCHHGGDLCPNGRPEFVLRLRDGFTGVERSFLDLLDRNGVKREDPTGAMFDPNLHQAMAEQESAEHPKLATMPAQPV